MGLNVRVPGNFKDLKKFDAFIRKVKKKYTNAGVEVGVVKNSTGTIKHTRVTEVTSKNGKVYYKREKSPDYGQPKNITVAEEAFYNCKGVPEKNIPPRDYQTYTIDENMDEWKSQMRKDLKKLSARQTCERIGTVARDATKATISEGKMEPPNAPITRDGGWMHKNGKSFYVFGKGNKPTLVDSGDLLKSITYQVIGKEEK